MSAARLLARPPRLRTFAAIALLLVIAADALFFEARLQTMGLPVPIFLALLAFAIVLLNGRTLGRQLVGPALVLSLAALALVEAVDGATLSFAVAPLAAFALAAAGRLPTRHGRTAAIARFLPGVMAALPIDLVRIQAAASWTASHSAGCRNRWKALLVWLMPVTFAVGFVLLLGSGNPILASWLAQIDLAALFARISLGRVLFWFLALVFVWAFLRPRSGRGRSTGRATIGVPKLMKETELDLRDSYMAVTAEVQRVGSAAGQVFGAAAILRALVLFNIVFALQTGLDAAYLWGGLELPEGLSYAAYAHRGAHTLILTALLAAAFVLVAMRPGTQAAGDRPIRALVYLWTGQTLVLVFSAMLRLDLYVEAYALTALRLAAFLWMGLVAVGLVLILARIALERSNPWLIKANLLAVALLLLGYGIADTTAFVARFNVEHSREVAGHGSALDVQHLEWLGPAALPAIDKALVVLGATRPPEDPAFQCLQQARFDLAATHETLMEDWRNWSFRGWRLSRYLDSHPAPVPPAPAAPALPPRDGAP